MTEQDFQIEVNKDLKKLGIKFMHHEKGRGKNKTHRGGIPDLLIFPGCGKIIFIELKVKNGKLKDSQIEFRLWSIKNNYIHYVVYDWQQWELVKKAEGFE